MKMVHLLIFALLFGLNACVTTYKRQVEPDGLNIIRVNGVQYVVRYVGNASIDLDVAKDYCLLRSAEIVLENGYSHFVIKNIDVSNYLRNMSDSYLVRLINTVDYYPFVEMKIIFADDRHEGIETVDAEIIQMTMKEKYGIN